MLAPLVSWVPDVLLAAHGATGYRLLVAGGGVLALRSRFPVPVLVACAGLSVAYYALGDPDGPGRLPLFVAAYTVTSRGDGKRSVATVAGVLRRADAFLTAGEADARTV